MAISFAPYLWIPSLLGCILATSCTVHGRRDVEELAGKVPCSEVRLKGSWRVFDQNLQGVVDQESPYSALQARSAGEGDTLYLALVTPDGKLDSLNRHAISLRPPYEARSISEHEWSQAAPLPMRDYERTEEFDKPIQITGRQFASPGRLWADIPVLRSGSGKFAAFASYNGWKNPNGGGYLMPPREPHSGSALFIEIYDLRSGLRLLRARFSHEYSSPGDALRDAFWVADSHFILPLNEAKRHFLICALPKV